MKKLQYIISSFESINHVTTEKTDLDEVIEETQNIAAQLPPAEKRPEIRIYEGQELVYYEYCLGGDV